MKWGLIFCSVLVVVALGTGGYYLLGYTETQRPIIVGILHSQTGPLAGAEMPMIDAEVLALEEINAAGGLLGRPVKRIIADGRSRGADFAQQAHRLITIDKASVLIGGYTSPCRKAIKAVVEESNHLLVYPAAYEGLERSPNIMYTGGPANQQVFPAVSWSIDSLKAKKFFLVGSDTVWSHVMTALAKDGLKGRGVQIVTEEYLLPESLDVSELIDKIQKSAPDVVISSLEGATQAPFYQGLSRAGIKPERTPVVSFSINETDLQTLPIKDLAGHYAAWNYMQSVNRPENVEFVRKYKARFGADRVTNDGIECAYNSVHLWAQAVTEAGTDEVTAVRKAIGRQSLDAPEGVVSIDHGNLNGWRPFFLGKVGSDGQFAIVSTLSKPIAPLPYPWTRPRSEWEALIARLSADWGGQWSNPARAVPQ